MIYMHDVFQTLLVLQSKCFMNGQKESNKKTYTQIHTLLFMVFVQLLLMGCTSVRDMPWKTDAVDKQVNDKHIYLLTAKVTNSFKKQYQPEVQSVVISKNEDVVNQSIIEFKMDSNGTYYSGARNEPAKYFIRLELEPGIYTIQGINAIAETLLFGGSSSFISLGYASTFFVPLHSKLTTAETGITYLGSITANVRERKGEEFSAGSFFPIYNQRVSGASTGTFEVTVSDSFDDDILIFRKLFPRLARQSINKRILAPFDRVQAQEFWQSKN